MQQFISSFGMSYVRHNIYIILQQQDTEIYKFYKKEYDTQKNKSTKQ